MLGYLAQLSFVTGEDPRPVGSMHPTIVPYGSFAAADGYIIIAVLSKHFGQSFVGHWSAQNWQR